MKPIAISMWEAWTQNIRMIKAEQQEVLRCTRDRIEAEIDQLKIKLITQNNAEINSRFAKILSNLH